MLDSIKFVEKDYPWLDDIRLLAKCELAHKAKNVTRENDLQQIFLKKQPLLFEPDIAVNFNLLMYQESLKSLYQARRKGAL
jgi:hypothetical protein